ncbi:MAG: choice-of-anchor D domain-containing protein [Bacteroidales bacterium]|nr:choice-of-anchor D domain-containing protein [Bacteroidales bacterium]
MKTIKQLFFAIFLLLLAGSKFALADNIMKVRSASVNASQVVEVEILIENDSAFVAFQLDIPMHDQLEFLNDSIWLNSQRVNSNHVLSDTILPGDTLRILGYSTNNTPFLGDTGAIVSFKLKAGTDPGDYDMQLCNAIIGSESSGNLLTSTVNGTVTLQAPDIHFSASEVNFGETPLTDHTDRNITIYNQGNLPLEVTGIAFGSPYFALTSSETFTLNAGGSVNKTIRFNSVVKGDYDVDMTVVSNDPDEASAEVNLIANAFAVNEIHTGNLFAFSGDTARLTFTINNMEPFNGFQFDLNMPDPLTFIEDSVFLSSRKTDHIVSANVLSGNKLRVVAYSASNEFFTGSDGDVLSMYFSVVGVGGYYSLNLSDVLIGDSNGMNSLSQHYNGQLQIAAADISCNTSMNFGDVSILGADTNTLTIYNTGNDTLEISGIAFTNSSYRMLESMPMEINPGQNSQVNVRFSQATEGDADGQMKIYSNDPDESPRTINLSAFAFVPNYLSAMDTTVVLGDTCWVDILVENIEAFVAFQVDMQLPAELSCVYGSVKLTGRKADHLIHASLADSANNKIRLFAYSLSESNFTGNEGAVARVPLVLDPLAAGVYDLDVTAAILGDEQSEDVLYAFSDGQLTVTSDGVPNYYTVKDTTISIDDTTCFNAQNTITVAGEGDDVMINSGGHVNFIAGNKIVFKPGFKATAGSYVHGFITTTNEFCASMTSNPDEEELETFPEELTGNEIRIKIYPNPSTGRYTIDFLDEELSGQLAVFNFQGNLLDTYHFSEQSKLQISLDEFPNGIYFLNIATPDFVLTRRIVKVGY